MITNSVQLPQPDKFAAAHSAQLKAIIQQEIRTHGPLSFDKFMAKALYTPGLGYYAAGCYKFGRKGDFITAPEISKLYSQCLARQCQQILETCPGHILECGAGTGMMAATLLLELEKLKSLPDCYYILEVSADLRERQYQLIKECAPHLLEKVKWRETLNDFLMAGIILGNEVLDAFPVHLFKKQDGQLQEVYVELRQDEFVFTLSSPQPNLAHYLAQLKIDFAEGYESECNLCISGWINSMSQVLTKGTLLLIDYGFPRREYYHPDRHHGTLMCHYQHHAHSNPLINVGLQDITAHIDFTTVAEAALASKLTLAGFANQASFLLSCGIIEQLQGQSHQTHYELANQIKVLTSPNEMGELFKVIAFSKNYDNPLIGFSIRDISERL